MNKKELFLIMTVTLVMAAGMATALRPGITQVIKYGAKTIDTVNASAESAPPQLIGGQTDEHGCLGPAGFSWNETMQKCVRPWNGEIQLSAGTMLVDTSDPKWQEKLRLRVPISTDIKCVDTDNGRDYYTRGIVYQYGKNPKKDSCIRHRFLMEWYCNKDKAESTLTICKHDCKNSACQPETKH